MESSSKDVGNHTDLTETSKNLIKDNVVNVLDGHNPSPASAPAIVKDGCTPAKGKHHEKNLRKKLRKVNDRGAASSLQEDPSVQVQDLRFQVTLRNGQFTVALKDALLRDLNKYLFAIPPDSFIPSFKGFGLRYGAVWFSPEDTESGDWLKQKLEIINGMAGEFQFNIEPFSLHQNKVCLRVPWDPKESLSDADVLRRINFQNPAIQANRWKVLRAKANVGNRLIFCSIDNSSLNLLKQQNMRLNYMFQKVQVKELQQKKSV